MAQIFGGSTFDANGVAPKQDMEILPPGEYPVMIVKSDMQPTKTGGQMLVIEMDVIDGEHKGRKIWDRLNLINQNAQAVEIAERTLSAICHAVGRLQVSDSEQLHALPMIAVVKVSPPKGEYGPKNEVSTYKPVVGQTVTASAQATSYVATTTPPATGTAPPWRKQAA